MDLQKKITNWIDKNMTQPKLQETKKVHKEYGEETPLFEFLVYEIEIFYKTFNGEGKSVEGWLQSWYYNQDFFAVHQAFADIYYHTLNK